MNGLDMIGYDDLLSITPFFNLRTKNALLMSAFDRVTKNHALHTIN